MTTTTGASATESPYSFATGAPAGTVQQRLLADILDQHSTDVLICTDISPGWQCLDVGAGAGTIATWLAEQVQPGGHVTAIDLDPRSIRPGDNLTVRQADIRTCYLPADHFDLIHARLVLLHLPEREAVLDRLVTALKPGGTLVVTDWDATHRDWLLHAPDRAAADAFHAYQRALLAILEDNGADLGWAHRTPLALRAAGLIDASTEVHARIWPGGDAGCLLHVANSHLLHHQLLARGLTPEQMDLLREAMDDPATLAYGYWTYTTVAHRPE